MEGEGRMRIAGDIKVWTDGDKACARLQADGPEGPIIVHASAPLAPIRQMLARQYARRGENVSGDDTAFKATVGRIGRRRALQRLRRMVPAAFKRGALGPFLARQELQKRKLRRLALARAGRAVGAKRLGRVPLAKGRLAAARARSELIAKARALPGAVLPRALLPALPSTVRSASSSPTSAPAEAPLDAGPATEPSTDGPEPRQEDAAAETPDSRPAEEPPADGEEQGEAAEEAVADSAETEAGDEAESIDESQEASVAGDDISQRTNFPGGAGASGQDMDRQRLAARLRLRAALGLLEAAKHSPQARQRVRTIVLLAGEGDPKANKALSTLKKATALKRLAARRKNAPKAPVKSKALVPAKKPMVPAPPPPPPPTPRPRAAPQLPLPPDAEAKWWDILAPWRRGIG
jgi:hypothetical protein